ncbi:MAG: HNH endonuclease domain-containing protein [Bacilli bacterium]|nr:HNH endonuclease domain-containing protein [Bacilli bacterium]
MLPDYIKDWLEVIEQMKNDNTYKPCFGRALIECIINNEYIFKNNEVLITFDQISEKMIRYYWNQMFFFNLKQSGNNKKPPKIYQTTNKLIQEYITKKESKIPVVFDIKDSNEIIKTVGYNFFNKCIKESSNIIPKDVLYRFMNTSTDSKDLYKYDINKRLVIFNQEHISLLKEYGIIIAQLLNYKWSQLLERYNNSPRIVNKVKSIAENNIHRQNLSKYKEQLLKQFEDGKIIDFYTGKELSIDDVSIDHVIPWSFMYSDDLWNLVVTSKSYNSSKSNSIPNEQVIQKLKERNKKILSLVDEKFQYILKEAMESSLVDKYYYQCRL